MRKLAVLVVMLVVAAPAAATPRVPRIWLTSSSPVVVAGRGFQSEERVKVVLVSSAERWAKTVVATRSGWFTARFRVSITVRCGYFAAVTATGSQGSRAMWALRDEQECPPPIDPGK